MYDVIKIKVNNQNVFFFPNHLKLNKDDYVIVEYENNLWFGICMDKIKRVSKKETLFPLPKVIRKATYADIRKKEENKKLEKEAMKEAKKLADRLHLNMNFINVFYTFDKKQLYFIYISEERIDFRELAKKLAQKYKTRIELRQIGVRDKAKTIGGLGPCGLFLCCHSFLTDFNSVSINMAKNQLLAINIDKISGACGRLLCCLKYEDDTYTDIKKKFPKIGSKIKYNGKIVKVIGLNVISDLVKIDDEGNISFIDLKEVKLIRNNHKKKNNDGSH